MCSASCAADLGLHRDAGTLDFGQPSRSNSPTHAPTQRPTATRRPTPGPTVRAVPASGEAAGAQKLSNAEGGLAAFQSMAAGGFFGGAVAALGDWDGDGVPDVAVGGKTSFSPLYGVVCVLIHAFVPLPLTWLVF